ncbi:MAG: hypothetical protein K6B28_04235 [Lachnospiraceae bacterium]|nr:hypothetical protein [Lachnospiraceae bacterium]
MLKKNIVSALIAALSLLVIFTTGDPGSIPALKWMAAVIFTAFLLRPSLFVRKLKFFDGGFALSFGLAFALTFLIAWFFSALFHIKFDDPTVLSAVIIPSVIINILSVKGKTRFRWSKREACDFLFGIALFVFLFAIAFYFKGFKSDIGEQTEQFMDFGFMQTIYRQKQVCPVDMWFSGEYLNYYYLGQASAVFLCRLSFVTPEYGYNFMLCTIFAILFLSVFSLIYAIAGGFGGVSRKEAMAGGFTGALVTAAGSNGHYYIYGIFLPWLEKLTGKELVKDFWFSDPTAFIGHFEGSTDLGKHEYPSYTIVLGDLHAHVCNMLFTIPLLAILFDYALGSEDMESGRREILSPYVFVSGILLGLYRGVNYWDFPIYFVVSGAVILFCDLKRKGLSFKTVSIVLLKGVIILITGTVVMIPFNMNFVKISSQIGICDRHSVLWQYIMIWWPFIISSVIFVSYLIISGMRKNKAGEEGFSYESLASIAVALCALGLIITPEFIYIKDIYGDAYQRYNTMFKLTFQAFILFGITVGSSAALFLSKRRLLRVYACIVTVMGLISGTYIIKASDLWLGGILYSINRESISAFDFMRRGVGDYAKEWSAIERLNEDEREHINIVEAFGESYREDCKLSVFTGACTVVGWNVHEWLWRGNWEVVGRRVDEVREFYESGDTEYCRSFLDKYDIDYIYLGPRELEKYSVKVSGFSECVSEVWNDEDGDTMIMTVEKAGNRE